MATLASLEKQIEALKKKADAIRTTEKSAAIKTARDLIQQYGLTAQDVGLDGGRGRNKANATSAPKAAGVPKYRDPQTGKTWTGHGKPPGWIAGATDRTKFLIDANASAGQAAATTAATAPAPKAAKATKAGQTTAVTAAPAKKASTTKVATKKAPPVKQAARAVKAQKAAPKAVKPAAKKAGTAKVQDKAAELAANSEAA